MITRTYKMNAGLLFVVALLLIGFQSPAYGESTGKKATWLWQTELISDGGEQILNFAREEGINLIYLQINRKLPKELYETFIDRAHKAQVAVHALGGDPRWALREHREDMYGLANWVVDYNANVSSEGRFDGIHLDIEPYVLNRWTTEQGEIISSWKENIEVFQSIASGSDLELGIDIPFWFDSIQMADGQYLNEWIIRSFDHITVLAYRNQADTDHGIIAQSKHELELADRLGKQVIIGVNTMEMPGEKHTTFYEVGKERMDQTLEYLTEALSSHPSFTGLAVHDVLHWQNMPSKGEGGDIGPGEQVPPFEPDPDPEMGERVPDANPVARDSMVRGTYIWEAKEVINNSEEILKFAEEKNLNWLYVRLDLEQPFSAYRAFVMQAAEAGIEVHAMGGHPIWALQENRAKLLRLIKYVKDYNRSVQGNERFHGIHLDIEPYVLPEWRMDSQRVISEWTSNMEFFVQELRKDSTLQASMDMAVWLDKYTVPGTETSLSKWMIDQMDHISLMAFRDTAEGSNGIVRVTKEEIAFAEELNKPIIISVEMKESHEGNHITFYEEGSAYMEGELAKLQELLKESTSFTGNVVHAYEYWKNGKP